MFRLVAFLFLAFLTLALSEESTVQQRIINGQEVSKFEWKVSRPWQAKNICDYGDGKGWVVCGCSSTIIHKRFLITAGHCLNAPYTYKVGLLLADGQIIDGYDQIKTSDWEYGSIEYKEICGTRGVIVDDVGLQYLKKDINFKPFGVQPFTNFFKRVYPVFPGVKATIAGWGATTEAGGANFTNPIFSSSLQKLQETVFNNNDCQVKVDEWTAILTEIYPELAGYCSFTFNDNLLCAGKKPLDTIAFDMNPEGNFGYPYDPTGICLGDSGSPLFDEWGQRILGFVSDTLSTSATGPCGYGVDIYTKLTQSKVDWVRQQVTGRGHIIE